MAEIPNIAIPWPISDFPSLKTQRFACSSNLSPKHFFQAVPCARVARAIFVRELPKGVLICSSPGNSKGKYNIYIYIYLEKKKWGTKGGGTADWASRTFFCNLLLGNSKLRLFIVVLLAVRNICPVSPSLPKPQNGRLRRSNHNFRAVTSRLNIALQRRRGNQPANCYGAGARRAKCNALLLASWNLSELHW